jgi:hypothetical protein
VGGTTRLPRREYQNYCRTQRLLVALVVVYVALAVERETVHGRGEIFPFASWSLFTLVPNEVRDYTVHITEINGRRIDPPLAYENSHAHFLNAHSHNAYISIQKLGRAVESKDDAAIRRIRGYFEHLDLNMRSGEVAGGAGVTYDIVTRRYDPVERWRQGTFRSTRLLATFRTTADTHDIATDQPLASERTR